jgi:hypothetical protein
MTTELEPVWDKIEATEAGAVEGLEWTVRARPMDVEADTPRERSGRPSRARARPRRRPIRPESDSVPE